MRTALDDLLRRRAVLQARSRIERNRLAMQAAALLRPVGVAERASAAVRRLLSRPLWMLALGLAALVVKPRRVLAWSGPVLAAWRMWRSMKDAMRR